jgi:hypothetical protein
MGNTGEHKSFADGEGGGGIAAAPEDRRPLPPLQWARFADLPPFGIGRDTAKRFRYFLAYSWHPQLTQINTHLAV